MHGQYTFDRVKELIYLDSAAIFIYDASLEIKRIITFAIWC